MMIMAPSVSDAPNCVTYWVIIYNYNVFIIQATGPDVIKLVKSKIYDFLKLVFVPGKPLRPGLMFASKLESYPIEV